MIAVLKAIFHTMQSGVSSVVMVILHSCTSQQLAIKCVRACRGGADSFSSFCVCRFGMYNVGGALLWTFLFVGAGFFFGNLEFVRHNFTLVVLAIVAVSVLPIIFEVFAAQREAKSSQTKADYPSSSAGMP